MVTAVPWMLEVMELCQGYDGTTSDAEKGDVSRTGLNLIRTSEATGVRGEVSRISAVGNAKPPTEYSLQIKVGDKLEFASQSKERPIQQGGPAFEQASQLKAGDCVTFSAKDLTPIA